MSVGTATNATNTAITDNTSSSATWYPTIVSATTGNLPQTTSSTKLSFVPSTGTLTATSHAGAWAGSTIGTTYGGTGLTSFTANGVVYASSTSALATSSALTFSGTILSSTYNNNSIQDGWMAQIMAAVTSTGGCNGGGPSMNFTSMNIGGNTKQMFAISSTGTPSGYTSITDQLGNFPIVIVNCGNALSSGWSTSIPSFWGRIYIRNDMSPGYN